MASTNYRDERIKTQASIGKMLPDFFGVFDAQQFNALYINPAGLSLLDPKGTVSLDKLSLPSIVGMNDIDRFQRVVFPQARILGSWAGALVLRDMSGSEFTCHVKLLDVLGDQATAEHWLYLHAHLSTGVQAELSISDRDMLNALLESSPDCVYFKDPVSRFLRISRVHAKRFGLENPRDVIGKTDFDFFTAEHATPAFQDEQRIMKTEKPLIDCEEEETFSDGTVAWVSTTKLPFYNREGKLIGTYGISRDITARKKAEDEIRKNEEIMRSTYAAAPIGIALIHERVCYKVNDLLCEIADRPPEELLGQSGRAFYANDDEHVRAEHALYDNLRERGRSCVETIWRRKDGSPIDVLMSAAPLDIGDSKEWQIVTVLDVTDKKHADRVLRENQAHLAEAQRIAHLGSWRRDFSTNELTWSEETRRIFGWPQGKPITFDEFLQLVHPDDRTKLLEQRSKALSSGQIIDTEYRVKRVDGEIRHVNEYGLVSVDAEGRCKIEGTVLDITERKKAEQDRYEMETRLQLAQKLESVGMLAAGVAHEINTPTQYIADNTRFLTDGFIQLSKVIASYRALVAQATTHPELTHVLKEVATAEAENELEYLIKEIPRTLSQSQEGLGRISRIVGSLKEFSHPNAAAKSGAHLNRAIETAVAVSHHEWKYVAEVVTDLDPTLPQVECILDEINQAVLNLIINAAHAIGDAVKQSVAKRGTITIKTRQEPGWAIIEVTDTGTGIPLEIRDRIFDPFFTTKGIGKGTGQGLAIVQAVITKGHGGRVDFTTEMGKGTTFRVMLPLSASHPSRTGILGTVQAEPGKTP